MADNARLKRTDIFQNPEKGEILKNKLQATRILYLRFFKHGIPEQIL
jgi:hypothetical protein